MSAARASLRRQCGAAAIEFALIAMVFVTTAVAMLEVARAMYMWSMLASVTRTVARAAIVTSPAPGALNPARIKAIQAGPDGKSTAFGADVTVDTIQVKYLSLQLNPVAAVPANGNDNIDTCQLDPAGPACVRFVQVQLCQAGTDCNQLEFKPVLPFLPNIKVPTFLTLLPVQGMGCTGLCT